LAVFVVFIVLSLAADEFFVPSVEVISSTLRLPQNLAGVRLAQLDARAVASVVRC